MSCLSTQAIRERHQLHPGPRGLVDPWSEGGVSNGRSYGLSSAGYDVRIAEDIWLWPLFGRLSFTIEHIHLPNDMKAELKDKSTNARKFISVQNTIMEPGWYGHITLELTRNRPWPIRIKRGTPIGQLVFVKLDRPTERPYAGKYQGQGAKAIPAILVADP